MGATLVPLSSKPAQLVDSSSTDTTLIVNVDNLNDVYISDREDVQGTRVVTLTPGKSIQWPAGLVAYARAATGTPSVNVIPGGDGMAPSAVDIATQAAAGYRIIDYVETTGPDGTADGAGAATVRFPAVPAGQMWQVTRMTIAATGNVLPSCRVYIVAKDAAPTLQTIRSGTDSGLFDEADYPGDGMMILGGKQLVAVWSDADPGADCTATAQYRLLSRA